jgi:hypothetical protein
LIIRRVMKAPQDPSGQVESLRERSSGLWYCCKVHGPRSMVHGPLVTCSVDVGESVGTALSMWVCCCRSAATSRWPSTQAVSYYSTTAVSSMSVGTKASCMHRGSHHPGIWRADVCCGHVVPYRKGKCLDCPPHQGLSVALATTHKPHGCPVASEREGQQRQNGSSKRKCLSLHSALLRTNASVLWSACFLTHHNINPSAVSLPSLAARLPQPLSL